MNLLFSEASLLRRRKYDGDAGITPNSRNLDTANLESFDMSMNYQDDKHSSNNNGISPRIIGGIEATQDRFSYAVSLQSHMGHFCGGTLIAKDVILTAAHCQGGPYDVVIGRHDLWDEENGEVIAIKSEMPHPNFDALSMDYDFMLVFLERAADVSNDELMTLNSQNNVPSAGQSVTVMGWGHTEVEDNVSFMQSDALMSVSLNIISNQECDASEGTIDGYQDSYHNRITQRMICAEKEGRMKDSCHGDSGGPLVIKGGNAGADVQIGVVSWGIGCAHDDFPGVYSRVSRVYEWIQTEACKGSYYAANAGFDCSNVSTGSGIINDLI